MTKIIRLFEDAHKKKGYPATATGISEPDDNENGNVDARQGVQHGTLRLRASCMICQAFVPQTSI